LDQKIHSKISNTLNSMLKENFEIKLLRKIEKILSILEQEEITTYNLQNKVLKFTNENSKLKTKLSKKNTEIKKLKETIKEISKNKSNITEDLNSISYEYQKSVELSVELLSDLEYKNYISSFIDIDINSPIDGSKIKRYGDNIKRFFLEELRCQYIKINYFGLNENIQKFLDIKKHQKVNQSTEYLSDRSNIYYNKLVDIDFPDRIVGDLIVGRPVYKDPLKESLYDKKIKNEMQLTKRLLENCISEIHVKDYSVKDALTGLYNRKILNEQLNNEFNNLDIFNKLNKSEYNLLKTIMKSNDKPENIIKKQYFSNRNLKDENLFSSTVNRLIEKKTISLQKKKHLGEFVSHYSFINSKINYSLFIAMFDLDNFKDINDNWGGHSVGDIVLEKFSAIMKKNIRTTDIPIRYGGEEFLIIFPRSDSLNKIYEILEKIKNECEKTLTVIHNKNTRNVTVSIGLTQISKYDENEMAIVKRADSALYRAKKTRNSIIVLKQTRTQLKKIN
jgi:diguanylate cyclase